MAERKAHRFRCVRLLILLLGFLPYPVHGEVMAQAGSFDVSLYQRFLSRYVVPAKEIGAYRLNVVDYDAVYKSRNDSGSLYRSLLSGLAAFDPASLKTREQKIAFWINAYNLGAVKMIIDHYPVESIRSRKIQWLRNPWDIKVLTVGGRAYSLGKIEHGILLGKLHEPRAHFAIVCASLSCPNISPEAYREGALTAQLEKQARDFLRDEQKGLKIDRRRGEVYFSQIFKFDKDTFPGGARDALSLIGPFVNAEDREYLHSGRYKIRYLQYDWSLNALSRAGERGGRR